MEALEALTSRLTPAKIVDPGPTPEQLDQILNAAAAAADHGRMKPWRFLLIEGEARNKLGKVMADSLKRRDPNATDDQLAFEHGKALRGPLVIAIAASVRHHPKVPNFEQVLAAAAAAQNMLVAAHALGLGGLWRTGGAAYDDQAKREMGFGDSDTIVGFLYLGTVGAPGKPRSTELSSVVRKW